MVTLADRGRIKVRSGERDLILHLEDGLIHSQSSTDNYRTIAFEQFHYIFRPPQIVTANEGGHIWGVPYKFSFKEPKPIFSNGAFFKAYYPWACLAFSVAIIPLGLINPRRGRSGAYLRGLILVVVYYILWLGAKEMTMYMNFRPHVLWLPPLLIGLFGVYSLYRSNLNLQIISAFPNIKKNRVTIITLIYEIEMHKMKIFG